MSKSAEAKTRSITIRTSNESWLIGQFTDGNPYDITWFPIIMVDNEAIRPFPICITSASYKVTGSSIDSLSMNMTSFTYAWSQITIP